jgi:phosphoenolpyruvate carboxykinase (GTP)
VTTATIPGLDHAPTRHARLRDWVRDIAELTQPDRIEWCDGSEQEWRRLTAQLVDAGTFTRLHRKPNSFWAVSDPSDVARVEERTFIARARSATAVPPTTGCTPTT